MTPILLISQDLSNNYQYIKKVFFTTIFILILKYFLYSYLSMCIVFSQIQAFIDMLFSSKPQENRKKWANYFINENFQTVQQIKGIPESKWKEIQKSEKLPGPIIAQIRLQLNSNSNQDITSDDKTKIVNFMNSKKYSHEEIVQLLGVKHGSTKGNKILQLLKSLTSPSKPFPSDKKQISVKISGQSLPLYHYDGKCIPGRKYFTFLVVGQTGTGKTTLLDAFVNYTTKMDFTDNWRWKLANQDHLKDVEFSHTKFLTQYYINDPENKFNIRIIDTPGFTSEMNADDKTIKKIQQFFKVVTEIDYILLTIKSSDTKLTRQSKYIMSRIMNIFGANAKDRFLLMCTFSDGTIPLCLKIISNENIPYEQYFNFNNSALYTPSYKCESKTQFFWTMAMDSIKILADKIIQNDRLPLSLSQSKQVLQTRRYIENAVINSYQMLNISLIELENARKSLKNLKLNKETVQMNRNYTQALLVQKITMKCLDKAYTMCIKCNQTCCQTCVWPANSLYSQCTYFDKNNSCPLCAGCPRSDHVRSNQQIIKTMVQQTTIIDTKKKAYDEGLKNSQLYRQMFKKIVLKIENQIKNVWINACKIKDYLKKLQSIALRPKMFTEIECFQIMIKEEEERKKEGWKDRANYLKNTIERMKLCQTIEKCQSIDFLFPQLKVLKDSLNE